MTRLTKYMKKMAARGNARVVQPSLDTAPAMAHQPEGLRDHAHRTRSGRELRALAVVLCLGCVETTGAHRGVFETCGNALCADDRRGCEQCGSPPPLYDAPLTRNQAWRRYGK